MIINNKSQSRHKISNFSHRENRHKCGLPHKEQIMVRYIDSGYLVSLRRRFRQLLIVCDTNPLSKVYLKSSAAIRLEKTRHLHYHYFMIHPFSSGRIFWEMFMLVVLSLLFLLIPLDVCISSEYLIIPKTFLDIFNVIDIVLTFNTGYLKPNTQRIIMNRRTVAVHYILGLFIFDVVTSFNVFIYIILKLVDNPIINNNKNITVIIKMLNYLRLFRIITWIRYLERFRQWKQFNLYKFKIFKMSLYYLLTLWWSACMLYVLNHIHDHSSSLFAEVPIDHDKMLECIYQSAYMLVLIGYGEESGKDIPIVIFQMAVMIMGNILHVYTIAEILHIVNKYHSSGNKYSQMIQQLQEFMRHKSLPDSTSRRILQYCDFRFQKNFFNEHDILATLSNNLRQEIFVHSCKSLIENVNIFRDLPSNLMIRMVSSMRAEIFLVNDIIVSVNTPGDVMYFINTGTVAVYTESGKEVCHLAEGAHFGEIALVLENENRVASVVAIDSCELFTLSRKDFQRTIEPYPEMIEKMREMAHDRLRLTMLASAGQIMEEDSVSKTITFKKATIEHDANTKLHYHV